VGAGLAVAGIGGGHGLHQRDDEGFVLRGPLGVDDQPVEGGIALLAQAARGGDDLAPEALALARAGSQMKAASMSPRSQAAAISGGRRLTMFTSLAGTPASFSPASNW
jgi:hypothetical protein